VSGRRSVTGPVAAVALVSFVLSAGYAGPTAWLYALFAQLPTGSTFRDPQRFRVLTIFCVIALSVPGFDAFSKGFAELRKRHLAAGIALAGALGVAAAACVVGGSGAITRTALCLLLGACVLLFPRRSLRVTCTALLLLLLAADVYLATRPGIGSLRAVPTAWLENLSFDAFAVVHSREVQKLERRAGFARLAFPQFEPTLGLGALGATYRVECLDPLAPGAWNELHERLSGAHDSRLLISRLPPERLATVYDIAGVRVVAIVMGTSDANATLQGPMDGFSRQAPGPAPALPAWLVRGVGENLDALPRAYFVDHWEVLPNSQALARVAAGSFDFQRSVILDRSPAGLELSRPPRPVRPAVIVAYAPEHVEIEVQAEGSGLLVLSDSFFPGWQARVDDDESEILRANGLFRAVALPAGFHRVRFDYRPTSLRSGAVVTMASAILLCVIPVGARLRLRRRDRGSERARLTP